MSDYSFNKISVIGAGAMGAYYASRFFEMGGVDVALIAGGERYERLRDLGLIVNGRPYAIPVRKQEEAAPSDLVFVAVKNHHLQQAIQDMSGAVGDATLILSVMNGIQSEEQLGAAFGFKKVLYAIVLGIDAVREGNAVTCSKQGRLFFGEAENQVISNRVKTLQNFFTEAGIVHETPPDMIRTLWWKYMINVAINQVSAILDAPYAVMQRSQSAQDLMKEAMEEVVAIARAKGIALSDQDVRGFFPIMQGFAPEGKTSMVQDVESRRKTEVETFAGKVVEMGSGLGIPTPVNRTLLRLLQAIESRW
jgi:2-dehydropantoate 2-reductase